MVDIRITYETLFDLLRREKNREELQSLDNDFYEQVLAYLKEKKEALSRKGDELFVSAEREKLKIQFQNIRRIIKELYERREKKIINMALTRVRTGSDVIDTSALLPSEKEFFDEQVALFTRYREEVLNSILHLQGFNNRKEIKTGGGEKGETKPRLEAEEKEKDDVKKEEPVMRGGVEEEKEVLEDADVSKKKRIRVISAIPEFVGLKGETIGPFNKGDVVELDEALADVLIRKGGAEPAE